MKLLGLIIALLLFKIGYADEIHKVKIDIKVNSDRSLTVTEFYEFTPTAKINHGLYRHLPTKYYDNADKTFATPLEILSVEIDGQSADYHTDHLLFVNPYDYNKSASERTALWNEIIYMGSKDVVLSKRIRHTTTLKYKINRIVKLMNDKEVIGWNIQGYDWDFHREYVELKVHLPENFKPEEIQFFQSYDGSRDLKSIKTSSRTATNWDYDSTANTITLVLNEGLGTNEDITFFIQFPLNTFEEQEGVFISLFHDHKPTVIISIGLILSLLLWFLIWRKHGIDPIVKRIRVLFGAPDDLSPSECRYFRFRTVDKRSVVALIVEAAIKGYVLIEKPEESAYMRITKTDKFKTAPAVIKNSINTLVKENLLIIKPTSKVSKRFTSLIAKMEKSIKKRYPNQFSDNFNYFMMGSIPLLFAGAACMFINEHFYLLTLMIGIVSAWLSYKFFDDFLEGNRRFWTYFYGISTLGLVYCTLFMLPNYIYVGTALLIIVFLSGIMAGLWRYLVKNQTALSRDKEAKIKAFEHYLKSTEERLMDFVNKPNEAPALFERNLPYAIALNCELKWVEAFESSIIDTEIDYQMNWALGAISYHYLSHSMVSTVETNSSYTAPSSSGSSFSGGGFSGGGFSGGGGFGGGGGGGW